MYENFRSFTRYLYGTYFCSKQTLVRSLLLLLQTQIEFQGNYALNAGLCGGEGVLNLNHLVVYLMETFNYGFYYHLAQYDYHSIFFCFLVQKVAVVNVGQFNAHKNRVCCSETFFQFLLLWVVTPLWFDNDDDDDECSPFLYLKNNHTIFILCL